MEGKELENAIRQAEEIANNGTEGEKEEFVEWASEALQWLSYQGDIDGLHAVELQYKAYLMALNKAE